MMLFGAQDLADLRRWAICGAVVVLAHGGIATGMVIWRDSDEAAEPAAAIVIEFAPVLAGPTTPHELQPGPEEVMSDASPNVPTENLKETIEEKIEQKVEAKLEQKIEEKVQTKPIEEPPPEVKPAPDPEVAMEPPPPQEVKQETPTRQEPRPPAPTTSAPQAIPEEVAAVSVAPEQAPLKPDDSKAVVTWRSQISALLERNKRYPESSHARREQGVAQIVFSLDRQGRLIESRVVRSSGATALDEEALALLRRAQPFPPLPREMIGDRVELAVPIRFNLK
jgi:periplasmic protein TonB